MNMIFLMDPLETVLFDKDTSLALMRGAQRRGHRVFYLPENGIALGRLGLQLHTLEVEVQDNRAQPFIHKGPVLLTQDEADVVFIRTDPPFDQEYLMNTWLLDRLPARTVVINRSSGIRAANEKIWCLQFSDLVPPSLVASRQEELMDFVSAYPACVAKPTDGFGGQGVFKITRGDPNTRVILETLTRNFQQHIILQEFIPQADRGDKRVLLLNGKPLGAVLRVHAEGDHRNNFFSGGKPQPTVLTARDEAIIARLAPALMEAGLYFVGIDLIGDYLIEVNVTSPTCLQEMNRFDNTTLEDEVIQCAETLAAERSTR